MTVWILVLFVAGGLPPTMLSVDDIASEEACRALGFEIAASAKRMNGSNRYNFNCYSVEKSAK